MIEDEDRKRLAYRVNISECLIKRLSYGSKLFYIVERKCETKTQLFAVHNRVIQGAS